MADRVIRCRPGLGTFVEITGDCDGVVEAGFEAISRVHALMSAHEPESDLSRINRFAHERSVRVDPWTTRVLERALFWSKQSRGAFDIVAAGAAAIENGHLPRHPDQPAPQAAHWSWLEISGNAVRLLKPGCIDLGGIAKGFAVDQAIAAMKAAGAKKGLVNAGGDLGGFGPEPWPVQVLHPRTRHAIANVAVQNGALATSAVMPDGECNHLPSLQAELVSATVCAASAMDADALTKIVLAGSPVAQQCLGIAEAEAFVLRSDGSVDGVNAVREAA